MTAEPRVSLGWPTLLGGALLLLGLGAGITYVGLQSWGPFGSAPAAPNVETSAAAPPLMPRSRLAAAVEPAPALGDVEVTLAPDTVDRAGIVVSEVRMGAAGEGLRAPGVVQPNAYRQVVVTPLVSGRVTGVSADLGKAVQRGEKIVRVFSPELAEAQTRYLSARAELGAHEQELARTETLVRIGAASRQELERTHAEHTARRADLEGAASRLRLLGLSAAAIEGLRPGEDREATVDVRAPIAGVVTERMANEGLNVEPSTPLVTVTDLSTVWVVVDVYEKDLRHVPVGRAVQITTTVYPERIIEGRVSFIDPQVSPETRTAKARIEVTNARGDLRLGMYAEARFAATGTPVPLVPRTAVQHIGDRTVVYLAHPQKPVTFIEREVKLGSTVGDQLSVLSGVNAGDAVVSEGSFGVRAERERLGSRALTGRPASTQHPDAAGKQAAQPTHDVQSVSVTVSDAGFQPSQITLRAGVPARLTFTRISDTTCATSIVFASLDVHKDLPLNQPVTVEFTPQRAGEVGFSCGMNMLRGTVVVR